MGHSHSQPTPLTLPPSLTNNHPLPTRISAAYQKSWTKITILLHDASTPTNNPTTPTYTITLPQGWYGAMTMHATNPNNPDPDSATPLAKADPAGRMRQDFAVGLPALGKGGVQRAEVLRYVVGWRHEVYWFAMAVGGGGGSSAGVERFEWRRSRGGEVKGVEGGSGWGWKLVRVGGSGGSGGRGMGMGEMRGGDGLTSDGKEVVAVWANPGTLSFSKLGQFEFRGSGATGELGTLWSIMAVMSCMCIWQKSMQSAVTAGVVAGAA